jgi:hypothetical protein
LANCQAQRQWKAKRIVDHTSNEIWLAANFTYLQKIAEEARKTKRERTFKDIVSEQYRDFSKVFSESESNQLPKHQLWDHTIDLKPNAPETQRSKVYPMPVNKQAELDWFIHKNLEKGYSKFEKTEIEYLGLIISKG